MASIKTYLKRTIISQISYDHWSTFSHSIDPTCSRREVRKSLLMQSSSAVGLGIPFFFIHFQLQSISEILSGMAILTALLFGLLVLMFDTGLFLRQNRSEFKSAHDIKGVITDLRMNVTYAVLLSLFLLFFSVVASVTATPKSEGVDGGISWLWSPFLIALFVHFSYTLILILKRLRQAFNYIDR